MRYHAEQKYRELVIAITYFAVGAGFGAFAAILIVAAIYQL